MITLSASKHELKIFSLSSSSPANIEAMHPILYVTEFLFCQIY